MVCTFTYFTMLYSMMLTWYLAAVVALSASVAHGAPDPTQTSLPDFIGAPPSLLVVEQPSADTLGSDHTATATDVVRAHNLMTDGVLQAYRPHAQRLPTPTIQKFPNPPFRNARFCYAVIHMAGRGEVIVKLPRVRAADEPECYNADFPTHSDSLGSAEIVLDLNQPSDATKNPTILDFSISPGDEKIAYAAAIVEGDVPISGALFMKSLVVDDPPLLLSQARKLCRKCGGTCGNDFNFTPPLIWDQGDLIFMALSESTQELQVLRHETSSNLTTVLYKSPFTAGAYLLSATKSYFFITSYALVKSQVMIARRSAANITWHRIIRVPSGKYFWTEELEGGIVLGEGDPDTDKRSLMSYIPSDVLDTLLSSSGEILEAKYTHQFEHDTSPWDIGIRTNGKCLLRHQVDACSGHHKLIAHSVESYTDKAGKQSTMLSESVPVAMELPLEDHLLSSIETSEGSAAALAYLSVMRAAQIYSFNCSTNALVLERVINYQGFDAEPYHESVERSLTPDGLPVSWRLVYRKDMVKNDGANPLIFFPDSKWRTHSSDMDPAHLRGMVELMDRGFILALARLDREQGSIHRSSLPWYLDAIRHTADQLKTVINRALQLHLTSSGRVAVVANKRVAMSLAVLINNEPDLLQAAVMRMAPLSIEALVNNIQIAIKSPTAKMLSRSLDSTKNLPLNGTSTSILVLDTSPSSASANSALEYVSALRQNANNTGLALLSVPVERQPNSGPPDRLLKNSVIEPFLLRTLCPNWLVNQTCV